MTRSLKGAPVSLSTNLIVRGSVLMKNMVHVLRRMERSRPMMPPASKPVYEKISERLSLSKSIEKSKGGGKASCVKQSHMQSACLTDRSNNICSVIQNIFRPLLNLIKMQRKVTITISLRHRGGKKTAPIYIKKV